MHTKEKCSNDNTVVIEKIILKFFVCNYFIILVPFELYSMFYDHLLTRCLKRLKFK